MNESGRSHSPDDADTDRDSRTEPLLVEGLDQYFRAHYEEAIHLWTRVLFIDRTHARARAYINRARTALGERQRRADEMLHAAGNLLDRGDLDQARRLLVSAEQASGADEKVAELWARLERIERTRPPARHPLPGPPAIVDARPVGNWRRTARVAVQMAALVAFGVLLTTVVSSPAVNDWVSGGSLASPAGAATRQVDVPLLSAEEVALVRARNLFARGRLAEALAVLDGMTTVSHEAEQMRVEIQRWLLMPRRASPADQTQPDGGRP